MSKAIDFVKWFVSLGKEPQTFLGAKWIQPFLKKVPEKSKRKWALRILNLSPHYFFDRDNPQFQGLSLDEYLEEAFELNAESRRELYKIIFKEYLAENYKVLEYGCGPGFLAKAVAPHVEKVYACDISVGALACADIVNKGENIEYVLADEKGLSKIENGSLDAIYSFAVIQHLTDEVFEIVLQNCNQKLKKNGELILHIQLEDDVWKTEDDWKSDDSLKGKLKYKYGLHCFGRTMEKHEELLKKHGFAIKKSKSLKYIENPNSSDADCQFLVVSEKV